ncbi:Cilia- and flagella-associated protein 57 [Blastocladiella emersonii ATCC 22665]|nr:Cilia- and flagella-associated protein 57 [Blastocladiella emersonii ATCC 22665]
MSIASVSPAVVFGVRAAARDPFQFMDEQSLVYIAGGNIVVYSPSTKSQKFVPSSTRDAAITALSITRERHYMAVGERVPARAQAGSPSAAQPSATSGASPNASMSAGQQQGTRATGAPTSPGKSRDHAITYQSAMRPVVHIYGMPTFRKRKTLSLEEVFHHTDRRLKDVVAISFSSDSKNVAIITADLSLSYWAWEKARSLGAMVVPPPAQHHHPPLQHGGPPVSPASPSTPRPAPPETGPPSMNRRSSNMLRTLFPTNTHGGGHHGQGGNHGGGHGIPPSLVSTLGLAVNPNDEEQIAVHAAGMLRIIRSVDGVLKPWVFNMPVQEHEVCSFAWVSAARFVIGARGALLVMENGNFKSAYILEPPIIPLTAGLAPPTDAGHAPANGGSSSGEASSMPMSNVSSGASSNLPAELPLIGGLPHQLNHQAVVAGHSAPASPAPAGPVTGYAPVDAMTMSTRLLVVACRGMIYVYERNHRDHAELFKLVCKSPVTCAVAASGGSGAGQGPGGGFGLGPAAGPAGSGHVDLRFRSLILSASEESLLAVTDDATCYMLHVSVIDLARGDALRSSLAIPSFHQGPITGMDTCVRKPFVVTCSTDKSIRVWNFSTFTCELTKFYPEEPTCVSIHPSGYYILAGFPDKLRLMTLLPDDLRVVREFPVRGCRECMFARGGHQFAAVQGSAISIYNVWTFDLITTLKAHNGRIRSLYWTRGTSNAAVGYSSGPGFVDLDDARLVSCGADGAVYTWVLRDSVSAAAAAARKSAAAAAAAASASTDASGADDGPGSASPSKRNSLAAGAAGLNSSGGAAGLADQRGSFSAANGNGNGGSKSPTSTAAVGSVLAKRVNEYILKGVSFSAAVDVAGTTFAVGSDRTLRSITDSLLLRELRCPVLDLTQIAVSQSGRMMFVATGVGTIKAVRCPFPNDQWDLDSEDLVQEHAAHASPVVRMRVTFDDRYLVSAAEDACVMVCRISDRDSAPNPRAALAAMAEVPASRSASPNGDREGDSGPAYQQQTPAAAAAAAAANRASAMEVMYADEVIVTKSDLEEKTAAINEMRTRLEELKIEQDYQLRLKDMYLQDKLKELTNDLTKVIESLKISSVVQRSEKEKEEAKHKDDFQLLLTRNTRALRDLENRNNQQLMVEYEKFQALQEEMRARQAHWEERHRAFEADRVAQMQILTAHYDDLLHAKADDLLKLHEMMESQLREFTEHQRQQNEDIESEVALQEARYEHALKAEREISFRLKGENGIMKKKFLTLNKEIEDNKVEMAKLCENANRLRKVMLALEREVDGLKSEMVERDKVIQEQERRVYELKKSNQELEKYKFVLDHKIKDLKKQIEPREQKIDDMKDAIIAANQALTEQRRHELAVLKSEQELRDALVKANDESAGHHRRAQALHHMLKQCQTDVTQVVSYIQDPAVLRRAVQNLHAKYCANMPPAERPVPTEGDGELKRQEAALRKTIRELKSLLESQASEFRVEHFVHVQENKALISEIRRLRQQRESLPMLRTGMNLTATSSTSLASTQSLV